MKKLKGYKPHWPVMAVYKLQGEGRESRTMTRRYKTVNHFYADVKGDIAELGVWRLFRVYKIEEEFKL